MPDVRRVVGSLDAALAPQRVRAMTEVVADALGSDRFVAMLLSLFAGLTLLLAVVGLYGVIAYSVSARLREMGVRMALGAPSGAIGRQVVGRSVALAGLGVTAGLGLAVVGSPALRSLLYGVGHLDPLTFGMTALVLLGVAVAASAAPALRAARVQPVEVLRTE